MAPYGWLVVGSALSAVSEYRRAGRERPSGPSGFASPLIPPLARRDAAGRATPDPSREENDRVVQTGARRACALRDGRGL